MKTIVGLTQTTAAECRTFVINKKRSPYFGATTMDAVTAMVSVSGNFSTICLHVGQVYM